MRWWQMANLLSLDAPMVAVVWQALLAKDTATMLLPAGRAALGLTVWAIYLADRLLDVREGRAAPRTARHEFTRRHRGWMLALLGAVLVADGVTVVGLLRAEVMHTGLVAAAGVALYLLVLNVMEPRAWFAKEAAVAGLFTAGVFLVAWTNGAVGLAGPAAGFAGVVWANLVAVEREEPGWWYGPGLAAGAAGFVWVGGAWGWSLAWSAAGLWGVHVLRRRVRGEARRLALDAVLLAPLVFLL